MRFLIFITTITCFIVFNACNDQPETASEAKSVFDMDSARSSISASNSRFGEALQRGDSVGLATFYTSDARVMPPNLEPISGVARITSFWGEVFRMGIRNGKLITTEIYGGEDGLTEVGNYELHDNAGKIVDRGKYIVFWKKENGAWKTHRDMWNSNVTPGAAPK